MNVYDWNVHVEHRQDWEVKGIPAGTGHADHCCLEYDTHWLEHLDARSHIDNLEELFSMVLLILFLWDFK